MKKLTTKLSDGGKGDERTETPAVEVQRVVRALHPWDQMSNNAAKLKAARASAARRRERKWRKEDELYRLRMRNKYRIKKNIPLDAPKMIRGIMRKASA